MSLQNTQAELADIILANDTQNELVQPAMHISIYRNNVMTNLLQTLKNIYPMVVKLVGEDFFTVTANEYIKCYPSRSGNLHDYGAYFSNFLADYQPVRDLIYLTEVAKFEWTCHCLFYAADHAGFNQEVLKAISPEHYQRLHFTLHPASQLIEFHFPILDIIDLCKGNIEDNIDVNAGGVKLLMIRRDLDICLVPLDAADYTFLSALSEHQSVAEALDQVMYIDNYFNLEMKLPLWIKNKTIVDCYLL